MWGYLWLSFQPHFAAAESPRLLEADTISRVVEQVEPAVVSILRVRPSPGDIFADSPENSRANRLTDDEEYLPNDYGTGVLVKAADNDRFFVLTTYHLVRGGQIAGQSPQENSSELHLRFHHRRGCLAQIFAADPRSDLAVLTFDPNAVGGDSAELRPLDWQKSSPVRKGDLVVCLGNPYALARDGSASVTWGIISNLARRPVFAQPGDVSGDHVPDTQSLKNLGIVLQIDARLQLGGSGGPVVNLQGELVGVSTSLAAIEGYEKSAGFAIPVAPPMRRIIDTLLRGQEVEYGLLGVRPRTLNSADMRALGIYDLQPSAVEVVAIPRHSPAQVAGLASHDILLKIDNQPVLSSADLMRYVGELPPQTEVTLQLYRSGRNGEAGQVLTRRSKLGKWPVKDDEGIIATQPKYPAWRGLRIDYSSSREKFVLYESDFISGVIVVNVEPGSRAAEAKLQKGDVITKVGDTSVQTPEQFYRAVKNLRGNVTLTLETTPKNETLVSIPE